MKLVLSPDLFPILFNEGNHNLKRSISNLLFNENLDICITADYINFIEDSILEKDAFQKLIIELSDTNRLKSVVLKNGIKSKKVNDEINKILFNCSTNLTFFVKSALCKCEEFQGFRSFEIGSNENEMDFILNSIFVDKNCVKTYLDFKDENEISFFFNAFLTIPNPINFVTIFNRDQHANYLKQLKGKPIFYYTKMKRGSQHKPEREKIKAELKRELGPRLRLFYSSKSSDIHERKILIDGLILTADNAFENIISNEPTWQIVLTFNKVLYSNWISKKSRFEEV